MTYPLCDLCKTHHNPRMAHRFAGVKMRTRIPDRPSVRLGDDEAVPLEQANALADAIRDGEMDKAAELRRNIAESYPGTPSDDPVTIEPVIPHAMPSLAEQTPAVMDQISELQARINAIEAKTAERNKRNAEKQRRYRENKAKRSKRGHSAEQ